MSVSYKKLFKLLIDKEMKKKDLQALANISTSSMSKMSGDKYVSMDVLVKVCEALNVDVGEVMEVTSIEK
jgi:putative transcriptional regulator